MSTKRFACLALLAALCLPAAPAGFAQQSQQGQEPQDVGLREQTGRRLAQLDVTVTGPKDALAALTSADFELVVRGKPVLDFLVDRVCRDPSLAPAPPVEAPRTETAPEIATTVVPTQTVPASYLFYFDQAFLTMEGRVQSMEMAREMIPELVQGGNRGMVISSGQVLTTYTELTDDVDELVAAVKKIDKDPQQWDPTVMSEESKIQEILDAMNPARDMAASVDKALAVARRHQAEERWRTERALQRLTMVLGRMIELNPPKAIVYFADRVRTRPGEHYVELFSANQREDNMVASSMEMGSAGAQSTFDNLTNEANAHGIRFYTIQAEGLQSLSSFATPGGGSGRTSHIRSAQDSLVGMALETGGQAFLNGIRASKITRQIEQDLSCVYLVSFDPTGFAEDRGLAVTVRVNRPGLKVQTRGQMVFQSESARRVSRLMAGFASPKVMQGDLDIHGEVIPTGFSDGKYTGLVQVSVPGADVAGAAWDLGASLVSRGKVREDNSSRIEVQAPGTPVVLETEMSFAPGPYEIVLVAHETSSDQVISGQVDGEWPNPNAAPVTVGPIAVMQPVNAAFVREGEVKTSGALGFGEKQAVKASLPTAMISLICRGKSQKGNLVVKRRLVGDSSASFDDIKLDLGKDRCAQVRDLIKSNTMTEGSFEYEVVVMKKDEELATGSRIFSAVVETASASSGPAGS